MAKCKICKQEDTSKSRSFNCSQCTDILLKCETCGNKKSKSKYRFCKKCSSIDPGYRNNLSNSLKGKTSWAKGLTKETNDSIRISAESKKGKQLADSHKLKISNSLVGKRDGINNPFYGKTHSEELKHKWSNERKGKSFHTNESKEKIRKKLLERYENGEIQKTPKSKWYEYKGVKCQGRTELKWVELNFDRIIDTRIYIETPYGMYIGDFDTANSLIEIKSLYTFKVISQNQLDKIAWINKNFKNIKFAIEYNKTFYEFDIDEGIDRVIEKVKQYENKNK